LGLAIVKKVGALLANVTTTTIDRFSESKNIEEREIASILRVILHYSANSI
jgi:hypothetical protein